MDRTYSTNKRKYYWPSLYEDLKNTRTSVYHVRKEIFKKNKERNSRIQVEKEQNEPKRDLSTETDEDMSVDEVQVNQRTKIKGHKTRIKEAKGLL